MRLACILFALSVALALGQSSTPLRAGDRAPNLVWTRLLSPSGPNSSASTSLIGQVTIVFLCPNISSNAATVSQWNDLVTAFSDKPAHFIWIASEDLATLQPFLETHPVKGSLLYDPESENARAYGVEMLAGAIVATDGRIAGFTLADPTAREVTAVLEGRSAAIDGDPSESQRKAIFAGDLVRLDSEPHHMARGETKPNIAPSYEVHISPSKTDGTSISTGPDFSLQRGFDLRTMLATIFNTDPTRIDLPASLDNASRYDFVVVLPQGEEQDVIDRLMQKGIAKHFNVSLTLEKRTLETYVITALAGKTPAPKKPDEESAGGIFFSSTSQWVEMAASPDGKPPTIEAVRKAMGDLPEGMSKGISEISRFHSSIEEFRSSLEAGLNRPVINETNLTGSYDCILNDKAQTTADFLNLLRDKFGLVLTPSQSLIDVVVVRPKPVL